MTRIILALLLTACSTSEPAEPKHDPRLPDLQKAFVTYLGEANSLIDENGWITPKDGDGMLWSGKFAAVKGAAKFKPEAAEVEPGRFVRCPTEPHCRASENPLWSNWSRDMFAGLSAYAWRNRDISVLDRHLAYGRDHDWIMGRPFGDGRSVYLPATYGRLYQVIYALGGTNDAKRLWPDVYPSGLTDYKAHMQMMNIWLRAEVAEALREGEGDATAGGIEDDVKPDGAALLDVDGPQLDRIKEHAARDPRDPFFQAMHGIYTGDFSPAIDALLAPDMYAGEYVRCDELRRCQLAAWLFAADLVLRRY